MFDTNLDLLIRLDRVQSFCTLVTEQLHLQLAVRQITTVEELMALARRHRHPIDHMDVLLYQHLLNEPFWPWFGKPIRVRRHFANLGRLPATF